MVYSASHLQVRVLGRFGSPAPGVEQWSTGFRAFMFSPASEADVAGALADLVTPFQTFFQLIPASSVCYMDELTGAIIGPDGKYVGGGTQATVRQDLGGPQGVGTALHPLATSLALSLGTDLARGRGSKGRMFWPALSAALSFPEGTYTSGQAGLATAFATFIEECNTAIQADDRPFGPIGVFSNLGTGTASPVTHIRVGRRVDAQERRERRIAEAYIREDLDGALAASERRRRLLS